MKIKNILAFILLPSFLFAQQIESPVTSQKWSAPLEKVGNIENRYLTQDSSGIYFARINKQNVFFGGIQTEIFIDVFNDDMKSVRSKSFKLGYKKKNTTFEDILAIKDKLYIFSSFNNRSTETNYLFVQEIKKNTLKAESGIKMIASVTSRNEENKGKFEIKISKDSSRILVLNTLPRVKKAVEKFNLHIYDENFNPVWEKDIELPYDDNDFFIKQTEIDNSGNVYMLGSLGIIPKSAQSYRNVFDILCFKKELEKPDEFLIGLEDKFINNLKFSVQNNNSIICSGFYSDKNPEDIIGTYYFRLNLLNKKMENSNTKPFDFDFRAVYLNKKNREKAKAAETKGDKSHEAELTRFELNKLITRNDGGAILIAEQQWVEVVERQVYNYPTVGFGRSYYNDYRTTRSYLYNYNDIIIANINPNGEIAWSTLIPKKQYSEDDNGYYLSYAMLTLPDKIAFMYNSNVNKADAILSSVNREGALQNNFLEFKENNIGMIIPKLCRQIGKRTLLVVSEKNNQLRIGKMIMQ